MRKKFYIAIAFLVWIGTMMIACQTKRPPTNATHISEPVLTTFPLTPVAQETVTMQTNLHLMELKGSRGPIYSLAWSQDGTMLASAGFARIRIWDAKSFQEVRSLEDPQSFVWGLAWLPDSSGLAAVSQDGLWLWSDINDKVVKKLDDSAYLCVSWSPDQISLATGAPSGKFSIWDANRVQRVKTFDETSAIIAIGWSPNGDRVAAGNQSGQIHLYRMSSWEEIDVSTLNSQTGQDVNGLAWSPDGSLLAAARQNGTVLVWDSKGDKILFVLEGHQGWARGLAWSPDGKQLASVGEDGILKIWSSETGELTHDLKMASDPLWSVTWSPDGQQVAVGTGIYNNRNAESSILIWSR